MKTDHIIEPEMVHIPTGYFWMGSPKSDPDVRADEKPKHHLYLPEYWIGRYPVTVAQFAAYVRETGYETAAEEDSSEYNWRQPRGAKSHVRDKADHPVTEVSWHDAITSCRWLSNVSGKHYTLPSEAEWEKAARGPHGLIYPWGDRWDARRCNNAECGKNDTTRVDYYSPGGNSPYGCADMAGNVWEWPRSKYEKYPYQADDGREDLSGFAQRVLRGGSFDYYRWVTHCVVRTMPSPDYRNYNIGIRVVVSPF